MGCLPEDVDSRVWEDWPFGWEVHEVHTYTEEVAFASQDDYSNLGLAQCPFERRHEVLHGSAIDGIGIFRSIELNQADRIVETDTQVLQLGRHFGPQRMSEGAILSFIDFSEGEKQVTNFRDNREWKELSRTGGSRNSPMISCLAPLRRSVQASCFRLPRREAHRSHQRGAEARTSFEPDDTYRIEACLSWKALASDSRPRWFRPR